MNCEAHPIDKRNRYRRRQNATTLVGLIASLSAASCAVAQTGRLSSDNQFKIADAISRFMVATKAPGISAAVVQNGELVWSAGFGMADLENSVPATSETLYRIGSISKPITATAAMALWEHGKLDLDSPVHRYCPAFPQKQWPVTTRELLGHLGGIRSYKVPEIPYSESESDPEVGNTHHFQNGIEGGLKFFASDPLLTQPGTHFNYSTQGYTLAGCALEGASGKEYAEAVREYVLVPAGMLQTRQDDRFAIIPLRTRFYSKDKSGIVVNADFLDSSYKVPGGGWLSSAPDMARFAVAILSNLLVRNSTKDIMWTAQMPSDGLGRMAYGLGWQLGATDGVKDVGHGGSQQGASAMILIAPEARAGVVVLINSDAAGASTLASQLLRIVLGHPLRDLNEITVDPKLFDSYTGRYNVTSVVITVSQEDSHLFVQFPGQQKMQIFPENTRNYFYKISDTQITFVTDGTGRATELIMHDGGTDLHANRIN